jgi:tRNA threonylcarbamoyladenosine biosynthesis protein TsaE
LALAGEIGRKLQGGEVLELTSDLGGGKTAFVRGLVQGMGSTDHVHSPSFTLANEYRAGNLALHHFDFHRLSDPGIMRDELAEILADPANVVAVEWADIVEDVLPAERLAIRIIPSAENESARTFNFTYPQSLAYLIPENT